jgi:oligoribonuclease NrnB/cAMP/cGMP phosphodiesterase (DHH superfamily)
MDRIKQIVSPSDIDIVIYHHPCVDGYSSAFVAFKHIGSKLILMPKGFNSSPTNLELVKNKNVLMVDIVTSDFQEIKKVAKNLIILDHHKTNQAALKDIPYAYFDMHKSGVGLAWEYFTYDEKMPLFLECIQDRDLWTWTIADSRIFCDGLYELIDINDKTFKLLNSLFNYRLPKFKEVYDFGEKLNEIKQRKLEMIAKEDRNKYEVTVDEKKYNVYIYNQLGNIVSDLGNYAVEKFDCDFVIIWNYNHDDENYRYSLRSKDSKTDVSEICKFFGGGGHRNAAGMGSVKHPKELFIYKKIE